MKTAAIIIFCAAAAPAVAGDESSGRYQLVAATTETLSRTAILTHQQLFRIDTATGQVWKFSSLIVSNKLDERWQPVLEDELTERLKTMAALRRLGLTNQTDILPSQRNTP